MLFIFYLTLRAYLTFYEITVTVDTCTVYESYHICPRTVGVDAVIIHTFDGGALHGGEAV